ncbi:MAG: tetratricopeptide repeat protein [Deltaproteobacteria bacterium]|nr:tetratricopeptide repeat protein [Deltaproteobacteria bacterium]
MMPLRLYSRIGAGMLAVWWLVGLAAGVGAAADKCAEFDLQVQALINQNNFAEARKSVQEPSPECPPSSMRYLMWGYILKHFGQTQEALEKYRKALELDPNSANAHNNLGVLYSNLRQHQEALTEFQEAVRLNPGYASAHNNLGNAYVMLGKQDEAVLEFQTALSVDPNYINAMVTLAKLYDRMERKLAAIAYLGRAAEIDTDETRRREYRAGVDKLTGELTQSIRAGGKKTTLWELPCYLVKDKKVLVLIYLTGNIPLALNYIEGDNPGPRFYLDLPGVASRLPLSDIKTISTLLKNIRFGKHSKPERIRIVLDVAPGVTGTLDQTTRFTGGGTSLVEYAVTLSRK